MLSRYCLAALLLTAVLSLSAFPTWIWADFYGSPALDSAEDMVTDSSGNVYFCGSFRDVMYFDASHSLTAEPLSSQHMFLCKLDPLGNVLWAFQNTNTGSNNCSAYALTVDSNDNVYVCGSYTGNMTLGGSTITNYPSFSNAFFAKVAPDGNVLWIQGGGGTGIDKATAVALDPLGRPVFAGTMRTTATFGTFNLVNQGDDDIFLVKLDTNGQWLSAKRFGGVNADSVEGMVSDNTGNLFLTGNFYVSTAFDSYSLNGYGGQSVFVSKLDPDFDTLWCSGAGGSGTDLATAIILGSGQTAYITGQHSAGAVFGSTTLPVGGFSGIFVAALGPTGNWLWASSMGINNNLLNQGSDILRRTDGDLIVTGQFQGTIAGDGYSLASNGNYTDIFVARCGSDGVFKWALRAGSTGNDTGCSLSKYSDTGYYVYGNLFGSAEFGDLSLSCDYADIFLCILNDPGEQIPLSPGPISIQVSGGSCRLSWPAVTQSTDGQTVSGVSYKVYRATRPDFADESLAQQTGDLFYMESLLPGTNYFYRVTANM